MRGFQAMIPPATWHELLQQGIRREYRAREQLLMQGAPETGLRLLTMGRVEVVYGGEDGKVVLLALRGAGDALGELASRGDGRRSASVVAVERCEAYSVPANAFHRVLAAHGVDDRLDRYIADKITEAAEANIGLAHLTQARRLARLLLRLVELAGPEHPAPLRIPLSQTRLAALLGISRGVVSKLVTHLRGSGVLTQERHLVVRDVEHLKRQC
jgi:CRP/FNR family cyclic AMP-dependent transcriptional regulator